MLEFGVEPAEGSSVTLRLRGDLDDQPWTGPLRSLLAGCMADEQVGEIVADLSEVSTINLEGIATLLVLWRDAQNRGKQFFVRGARPLVQRKLEETGIARRLDEAVARGSR